MSWKECRDNGTEKEVEFHKVLKDPIKATKNEDMHEHWDVSDRGIKYDVKGMKKFRRKDLAVTDRFHYIEIKNVRGENGWLYGKADYIAFETRSYWVIICRPMLAKLIDPSKMSYSATPQIGKLYSRTGRADLMTLMTTVDLIAISDKMIKKPKPS